MKRRGWMAAVCRLVAVLAGLTILLMILQLDDVPPAGSTVAQSAATTAAAQVYEDAMTAYGDQKCAEYLARAKYEEVVAAWEAG